MWIEIRIRAPTFQSKYSQFNQRNYCFVWDAWKANTLSATATIRHGRKKVNCLSQQQEANMCLYLFGLCLGHDTAYVSWTERPRGTKERKEKSDEATNPRFTLVLPSATAWQWKGRSRPKKKKHNYTLPFGSWKDGREVIHVLYVSFSPASFDLHTLTQSNANVIKHDVNHVQTSRSFHPQESHHHAFPHPQANQANNTNFLRNPEKHETLKSKNKSPFLLYFFFPASHAFIASDTTPYLVLPLTHGTLQHA